MKKKPNLSLQIKVIPFHLPFLPTLAEYILKNHLQDLPDLGSILVVFPSQRNKYYLQEYLLQASGREGIIPPCLFTIEELYFHLFDKMGGERGKVLEELERNAILKEAVERIKAKNLTELSFINFISIGRRLLGFFDELKSWNFTIEKIERMKETLHFPSKYVDEELPILRNIHEKYEELIKNGGFIEPASIYLLIAENFKREYLEDFKYIYMAGFVAFTFTDSSVVKKILTSLPSQLILHSREKELKNSSLENIFYHHHKMLLSLMAHFEKIEILKEGSNKKKTLRTYVYIQQCKNVLGEVSFIIHTLFDVLKKYSPHRLGVILPDESLYLPLIDALEKFTIPYNLSMGIPFKHSPFYSFLKSAYELIDSDFHTIQFLHLLKEPLLKGIIKEGVSFHHLIYKLDHKIREKNLSYINSTLLDSENKILLGYLYKITKELKSDYPLSEYIRNVKKILQELFELNEEFYSVRVAPHNKNTEGFLAIVDELTTIETSLLPLGFLPKGKNKLKFLLTALEGLRFPTSGDFLNGIQVIGLLEARNIDFDCVILPSCNEGILPGRSEKDLFLPVSLRKEAGLPYYKEREALYSYYFHQLITGKKEVYLSYRTEEKTEGSLRSRWIEKLIHRKDENVVVKERNSGDFANIFVRGRKKVAKRRDGIKKDSKVLDELKNRTFSPSSLRTYKECPYKFYLSYILQLKKPKAIYEEYHPPFLGSILHHTFRRLYNEFYPQGYRVSEKREVIEVIMNIGEEELKKLYPYSKSSLYFEWEMYKRRLESFIDREILRFREGFKPIRLEKELLSYVVFVEKKLKIIPSKNKTVDLNGPGESQGLLGGIRLGGIPDRIDEKDDKFYMIDYKITKRPSRRTYRIGKDFTEFQLPLYALIFTNGETANIGGLIYYHLDEDRENFVTLDILQKEGIDYLPRFMDEILYPVLVEIFNLKVPFRLTNNFDICQRCIFIDHCRRRL